MEVLLKENKLSDDDMRRVYLALASGALDAILYLTPGPSHMKKKRMVSQLRELLPKHTMNRLPGVATDKRDLFGDYISAGDTLLKELIKESKEPINLLLNLVQYCSQYFPIKKTHFDKVNVLFDLWDEAKLSPDLEASGEAITARLEEKAKLVTLERVGIPSL
jgi:hypothetical protein